MNTLWLVLAISLPSLLVAIALAVMLIKRKAQDRSGVERLLAAIKAAEPEYRQALLSRFAKAGNLSEPRAAQEAEKLVKQRRQYFKQMLAALLNRDPSALLVIEPALRQFGDAHLQLFGALVVATPAAAIEPVLTEAAAALTPPAPSAEASLRGENDRLRREVGLTLSALNNIFAEYASMFGDEHTRRDMNLEEILSSMQQLAAGQPPESADESASQAAANRPLQPAEDGDASPEPLDLTDAEAAESAEERPTADAIEPKAPDFGPQGDPFAERDDDENAVPDVAKQKPA